MVAKLRILKDFKESYLQFIRKRFHLKKETHSRWSGKNCYEKESDVIHHRVKDIF